MKFIMKGQLSFWDLFWGLSFTLTIGQATDAYDVGLSIIIAIVWWVGVSVNAPNSKGEQK